MSWSLLSVAMSFVPLPGSSRVPVELGDSYYSSWYLAGVETFLSGAESGTCCNLLEFTIVTLQPAQLASANLCNLDPLHPALYYGLDPSGQTGVLGLPHFHHRNLLTVLLCKSVLQALLKAFLPQTSPSAAQCLLSKFPLQLFSQLYDLAFKIVLHISPNIIAGPLMAGTHVFSSFTRDF